MDRGWREVSIEVAVDVTNPLCGPDGASAVYGPQKGADADMVKELDAALGRFAELIGREIAGAPGAGAAGGAGAGLMYFLGARLRRGAPLVIEAAGLDQALRGADVCVTGEGRVDGQSAYGKGPVEVARRARAAGVPVVLIAGGLGEGWEAVLTEGVTLVDSLGEDGPDGPSLAEMMLGAEPFLCRAAARSLHRWKASTTG
jgi:glycerate kinase